MNKAIEKLLQQLEYENDKEALLTIAEIVEKSTFKSRSGAPYVLLPDDLEKIVLQLDELLEVGTCILKIINQKIVKDKVVLLWLLAKIPHIGILSPLIDFASTSLSDLSVDEVNQLLIALDNHIDLSLIEKTEIARLSKLLIEIRQDVRDNHPIHGNVLRLVQSIEIRISNTL